MADDPHAYRRASPETLEKEKAEMQAAASLRYLASYARLRESHASSHGDTGQPMNTPESVLQTIIQQNEALKNQLDVAKTSTQDLTEQLQVANECASASEDAILTMETIVDKFDASLMQLADLVASQHTGPPETDLTNPQQQTQADPHQEGNSRKRKASTERPVQLEGDSKSDQAPATAALTAGPVSDERATDTNLGWAGPVIDSYTKAEFQGVVTGVNCAKSPNTLDQPWETLLPQVVQITDRIHEFDFTERLHQTYLAANTDTIVFRLTPASKADGPAFSKIFRPCHSYAEYGVFHGPGPDNVKHILFMIMPAMAVYSEAIRWLLPNVPPRPLNENMLFLVIVYGVKREGHEKVRLAWDTLIKTVHSLDLKKLVDLRDSTMLSHPLPLLHPRGLLLHEPNQLLRRPPLFSIMVAMHEAELIPHFHRIHHIAYFTPHLARALNVDGVKLPECVFFLGIVSNAGVLSALLVDMMAKDRHLWHVRLEELVQQNGRSGMVEFTLLARKFPASLEEWETATTWPIFERQLAKMVKLSMKFGRYVTPWW